MFRERSLWSRTKGKVLMTIKDAPVRRTHTSGPSIIQHNPFSHRSHESKIEASLHNFQTLLPKRRPMSSFSRISVSRLGFLAFLVLVCCLLVSPTHRSLFFFTMHSNFVYILLYGLVNLCLNRRNFHPFS
jgi:hypothetical protein